MLRCYLAWIVDSVVSCKSLGLVLWLFQFQWLLYMQEITSTGVRKGEIYLADVSTKVKNKNITTDVKVDTNSNVS